jgi:hypothetical protein
MLPSSCRIGGAAVGQPAISTTASDKNSHGVQKLEQRPGKINKCLKKSQIVYC